MTNQFCVAIQTIMEYNIHIDYLLNHFHPFKCLAEMSKWSPAEVNLNTNKIEQ
jgi:hypothetical protein